MRRITGTAGYVVGKKAAAPDGTTVVIELEAPLAQTLAIGVEGGRARALDAVPDAPTVRITTDGETYARLACGRGDPAAARAAGSVRIEGDEAARRPHRRRAELPVLSRPSAGAGVARTRAPEPELPEPELPEPELPDPSCRNPSGSRSRRRRRGRDRRRRPSSSPLFTLPGPELTLPGPELSTWSASSASRAASRRRHRRRRHRCARAPARAPRRPRTRPRGRCARCRCGTPPRPRVPTPARCR